MDEGGNASPDESQTIRQNMVDTATNFLKNPQVVGSPMAKKIAFLEGKGLTSAEIDAAIKQAGVAATDSVATATVGGAQLQVGPPPRAPWGWKEYFIGATVAVGGAVLVKDYVIPMITWPMKQMNDKVETLTESVNSLKSQLEEQTKAIQENLTKLTDISRRQADSTVSRDIQNDVAAVKSMLLNKNRFPKPPTPTTARIPEWQRKKQVTSQETVITKPLITAPSTPETSQVVTNPISTPSTPETKTIAASHTIPEVTPTIGSIEPNEEKTEVKVVDMGDNDTDKELEAENA
eukprot:m.152849 g.152849  ORF g.152849 m.152849 type:complete len:292 (+) comp15058_c0_seq2:31-906(+)